MKRLLTKKISSCTDCHFITRSDGFASHSYGCFISDLETGYTDGSKEENLTVENQLAEMFKNCPEWDEV